MQTLKSWFVEFWLVNLELMCLILISESKSTWIFLFSFSIKLNYDYFNICILPAIVIGSEPRQNFRLFYYWAGELYLKEINYHHHHHGVMLIAPSQLSLSRSRSLSLLIHPYRPSLRAGSLDCILCPHRVDVCLCWSVNSAVFVC